MFREHNLYNSIIYVYRLSSFIRHITVCITACSFTDGKCRSQMVTGNMQLYGDIQLYRLY
jgi:hypothetical protein